MDENLQNLWSRKQNLMEMRQRNEIPLPGAPHISVPRMNDIFI